MKISPQNNPYIYDLLIFDQWDRSKKGVSASFFFKWHWENWLSTNRITKLDPHHKMHQRLGTIKVLDGDMRETIKLLDGGMGGSDFSNIF